LQKKIIDLPNVNFDENPLATKSLHQADILITDQSGIAFEYTLGTERPTLFIDTPLKIQNPEYQKLGIEPIEINLRSQLGTRVPLEDIKNIAHYVYKLEESTNEFKSTIPALREKHIFNWMSAANVGSQYINDCTK